MQQSSVPRDAIALTRMPHVPQLDGLRAVAIVIVFIGHLKFLRAFPSGFGVTIFFFLSGYLITTLLRIEQATTGRISLRGFYLRRVLRINPPLWLAMAFAALLFATGLIREPLAPWTVVAQAFFFVNYMPTFGQGDGLPIPLWSLAVEEHFYLLFPLCFAVAMRRMSALHLARWCAWACVVVLAIRMFNIVALGEVERNYYWTHTRIDSILFGCVLALWNNPIADRNAWRPRAWHLAVAIGVILVTFVIRAPAFREGIRYTLQGVGLFVVFAWLLHDRGWVSRVLRWPLIQRIGLYSYTLYLVHYGIIIAVQRNLSLHPLAEAALAAAVSMLVAAAMYAWVERPLARLRHRLNAAERPAVAPASVG